jgi:quinohemoprotein ethanol dehydrogenase
MRSIGSRGPLRWASHRVARLASAAIAATALAAATYAGTSSAAGSSSGARTSSGADSGSRAGSSSGTGTGSGVGTSSRPSHEGYTNWYSHNGTHDEANYSPLSDVNAATMSRLGLAWSLDLPGESSLEATPLAIDGTLYFSGSSSDVYAVDAVSGHVLWKYDPRIWEHRPEHLKLLWGINRGVAYSNGTVFVGTHDGRLVALNALNGRVKWSVKTVADDSLQTISGAPWVVKGKVVIGNGGADFNARGYVTAYDEKTGKQLWRFYTVPGDPNKNFEVDAAQYDVMKMAAATWGKDWWKVGGGGGTVWDNMTYDPELNRIYLGVGNGGPWNSRMRSPGGGDNLFLASIVAVDADTGRYLWHYQANPGESWDYKNTANLITADLNIDGRPRKVLMQSPTNGFFYVIDRLTGKLISAQKTGKVTWADHIDLSSGRPVESTNIRYENGPVDIWPSAYGTHNWQGMSYSPQTGLVYIPYMQLGARYTDERGPAPAGNDPPMHFGGLYIQMLVSDSEDNRGALLAWDPVKQQARWKVPHPTLWNGGALSTAGGVVFQGTADGKFLAYDASTGRQLWQFAAAHAIIASPITYTARGKQYISVLSGYGGATTMISELVDQGWKFGAQPRRLLTFALDGTAALPPTAPADRAVHALDDPGLVIDEAQAKAGFAAYGELCSNCHGRLLVSAGSPAPDLRESPIALNWASLRAVVKDGALLPKLMPRFEQVSDERLRSIYMYIRAQARGQSSGNDATHTLP